ncbi:aminopeptidase N [Candidatus Parabeggiatoa sp. HSG14]|uniref:aminopeptidase N n=1 Tax=Candidatus Parabeggiatoa sp. HSG14 TaxID=3055593 RepID=UPI0025A79C9C|nr:aminopeptidase N [Thiotrichales bacterium HSG14]
MPPLKKLRKDYQLPDYLVDSVKLHFDLGDQTTVVSSKIEVSRNLSKNHQPQPLVLDGEQIELLSLQLDGRELGNEEYQVKDEQLIIHTVPERFSLQIKTRLDPSKNTDFTGLYLSSGTYCTQCEPHGFRRMTYFVDRPDVMTVFTTTVLADKKRYPVLLSNGNPQERGDLNDGRHWVTWHDPFKKPSYLFALVAGDLAQIADRYTTGSGHQVALEIYVEHENREKCDHAMRSLKNAMAWDEKVFGLEYDLDIYMIVAVNDFNMGAMENKGLNVFNSKFVLAKPETATDTDFNRIEGVIAHEYFHNWTGNRVTCRDWFQLSLKEGLTVFRDQEFSSDMGSRAVTRINEVKNLRIRQFSEDSSPMAHPIRPDSYIEMNNFYTATVYNKGAEVIRMMHTLLGADNFRKGMDLYFQRHDGQAVTCDDFVSAMQDASGYDLEQFKFWYSQAGTPELQVSSEYDSEKQHFKLFVEQSCPSTPEQAVKQPFLIPFNIGLINPASGKELDLQLVGENNSSGTSRVLSITQPKECFEFVNIPEKPMPSLLRSFSAPVKLDYPYTNDELGFLVAHDPDSFACWEASQCLSINIIKQLITDAQAGKDLHIDEVLMAAYNKLLKLENIDKALLAQLLELPSETYIAECIQPIEVNVIHQARDFLQTKLASRLENKFLENYQSLAKERGEYRLSREDIATRLLKSGYLKYLLKLGNNHRLLAIKQYNTANNMTDQLAALNVLVDNGLEQAMSQLEHFYQQWQHDPLVIDKWFGIQAIAPHKDILYRVQALVKHEAFNIKNPNKVYALIGSFSVNNPIGFHRYDGAGYQFLGDIVLELNSINPMIAARLVRGLINWRKFVQPHQDLMKDQLERIANHGKLCKDVYEIVSKSLKAD